MSLIPAPWAPYALLIKAGVALAAALALVAGGWKLGGMVARAELADYRAEVAEKAREATLAAWDRADATRKDVEAQAQTLAAVLADQARENGSLRAELAEARRRGTLIAPNPTTSCPDFGSGFVSVWNRAAALRPTAAPTD